MKRSTLLKLGKNTIITLLSKSTLTDLILLFVLINLSFSSQGFANFVPSDADSLKNVTLNDSTPSIDTTAQDSTETKKKDGALEAKVEYASNDSITFDVKNQKMFLFGDGEVKYDGTTLKADYIEINLKENELFAKGKLDSANTYVGRPYFDDKGQNFDSDSIKYNFKSKKGKINKAKTQDGDGYVHGSTIKKVDEEVLYIKDGKYTTCSHDDPHFHIQAKKLKVIKNKSIITGPASLKVAEIPTPLALPFGYFPNKKGRASGIIIPTYGESPRLGFFLSQGGYYLGLNDYMDLSILGDIYSRGSWELKALNKYKMRYRYNGSFSVSYRAQKESQKEFSDFQDNRSLKVIWNHRQDPKAKPNSNFSANVNVGSSNRYTNDITSTTDEFLTNNINSNITYNKQFMLFGKLRSGLTLGARSSQVTSTKSLNVTLPSAVFSVNDRWYPFKQKNKVGKGSPLEKLALSYNANFQNSLNTTDDSLLFNWEVQKSKIQNGFKHTAPVILPQFKVLKYLNFSPRMSFSNTIYKERFTQRYLLDSTGAGYVDVDTINQIGSFFDGQASLGVTTKIYGMYNYKSGPIKAIRHVMTPTATATFKPDFSKEKWGYYQQYVKIDTNDVSNSELVKYSRFDGIHGRPSQGNAGIISLGLINNLEMKLRNNKDSTSQDKKVKILENLGFNTSYNIFADSLRWGALNINGRTNLFKALGINFRATLDPYQLNLDSNGNAIRVNAPEWKKWDLNSRLFRMTNANVALSLRLKGGKKGTDKKESDKGTEDELAYINENIDDYVDFNIPWNLNVNYNFTYSKPIYEPTFRNSLTFRGDINVTKKWKIGFSSGYDIKNREFTITTLDIYRDLHCWDLKFNVIPFGTQQRYQFDLKVKAPVLQDLKLTRKRNRTDF